MRSLELPLLQPDPSPARRLPSPQPLLAASGAALAAFGVLAAVVLGLGGSALDGAAYAFVQAHRSALGTGVATVVTAFGSYQLVIVLTVAFALTTYALSRRFTEPLVLLISAPFTSSLVLMIKVAAARTRPPSAALLGEAPTDYSFPSGHTTSGSVLFLLAAVLISAHLEQVWARRLVRTAGVLAAVLVGLSRVYLGYHWSTDVLGGWLLAVAVTCGALAAVCVTEQLRAAADPRLVAIPQPVLTRIDHR